MTTPAKRGRPSRLTPRKRAKFLQAVREGRTLSAAAEATGMGRRAFAHLAEADPEFATELEEAKEAGIDRLEDALIRAAEEGWHEEEIMENGAGEVVRRVTRHRKDPRLLQKVREWRGPPVLEHRYSGEVTIATAFPGIAPDVTWRFEHGRYVEPAETIELETGEMPEIETGER